MCLDALLDGNGNVSKLKKRISALLATDATKAEIERDIKTIYDLRSEVVHGKTISDMDFKRTLGALIGLPDGNLDFRQAESAVNKARDYDRRLIQAVMRLVQNGQVELDRALYERLDHVEADPQARLALQRLASTI